MIRSLELKTSAKCEEDLEIELANMWDLDSMWYEKKIEEEMSIERRAKLKKISSRYVGRTVELETFKVAAFSLYSPLLLHFLSYLVRLIKSDFIYNPTKPLKLSQGTKSV